MNKLLLFDLDGTLLDSRKFLMNESFRIINKYYPNFISINDIKGEFGNGFKNLLPKNDIEYPYNLEAKKDFYKTKKSTYHKLLLFDGVKANLHELKINDYKLGIHSSQKKEFVLNSLITNNIFDYFDLIITGDDVGSLKPSPEGINKAKEITGFSSSNILMIGDSYADIMAGINANVKTVLLDWYSDSKVNIQPDFIYDNLDSFVKSITNKNIII